MTTQNRNYYAFRTDRNHRQFMYTELQAGRLRQGWGFEEGQDLRHQTVDKGATANLKMLLVEKGDIILIPGLPSSTEVIVAEATVDWNAPAEAGGYRFEIHEQLKDYGHIFPVKILKTFERHHQDVPASIRRTFRAPMRFWSLDGYAQEIDGIIASEKALSDRSLTEDKVMAIVKGAHGVAFDSVKFGDALITEWYEKFGAAEWEEALVVGLSAAYPNYQVDKVGGSKEEEHGTDILIRMPRPFGAGSYGIAVQVKDYSGNTDPAVIVDQINKSNYWERGEEIKVIEKVILLTGVSRKTGSSWINRFPEIKFFFADDVKSLLIEFGEAINRNRAEEI
jgi:hypothetical protein